MINFMYVKNIVYLIKYSHYTSLKKNKDYIIFCKMRWRGTIRYNVTVMRIKVLLLAEKQGVILDADLISYHINK